MHLGGAKVSLLLFVPLPLQRGPDLLSTCHSPALPPPLTQGYEPFLLMSTAATPFYDERFR